MWKKTYLEFLLNNQNSSKDEINNNLLKAKLLKYNHIPQQLYKYYPISDYSLQNFENDTVFLNSPNKFNDLFECQCEINADLLATNHFNSLDDTYIQKLKELKNSNNALDREAYNFLISPVFKELLSSTKAKHIEELLNIETLAKLNSLITCFSEDFTNQNMWFSYANNHSGFCLKYDFTNLLIDDMRSSFLYPVIYEDTKPNLTNYNLNLFPSLLSYYISMFKHTNWSGEKEWRLIFHNIFENPQTIKVPIPSALYLGFNISIENKKKLIAIAQSKGMEIYQMKKEGAKLVPFDLVDELFNEAFSTTTE